jgi:hypothetical protein
MKALTGGWSAKLSYFCYLKFSPLHSRWPSTLLFLILSLWFPSCINWPLQCQWEDCMYNVGRLIIIMKNLQFHLQNINLNFLGSSSSSTQEWSWQSGFGFSLILLFNMVSVLKIWFISDLIVITTGTGNPVLGSVWFWFVLWFLFWKSIPIPIDSY